MPHCLFQSTPLMRGETHRCCGILQGHAISIHSPHARGDSCTENSCLHLLISIHSPHARGDSLPELSTERQYRFQSTPLTRGETMETPISSEEISISIHSPHARGDRMSSSLLIVLSHFNPLPSREGRPQARDQRSSPKPFQSTPLTRGETAQEGFKIRPCRFQSTPLTRGETERKSGIY